MSSIFIFVYCVKSQPYYIYCNAIINKHSFYLNQIYLPVVINIYYFFTMKIMPVKFFFNILPLQSIFGDKIARKTSWQQSIHLSTLYHQKQNLHLTSHTHSMTRIVWWNCKGLRARHEEVQLLMNKFRPSCICQQEVMLENVRYNLGREYKFYAKIPPGQRSKGGAAVAIKIAHKRLNIRTTLQVVAQVYMAGKRKRICSI